jgi:OOP family OmpA-OmpF porin
VAAALGEAPGLALEIQGHADSTGSEDANQILSQARADAVLTYLVDAGVNPERLTALGFGSSIPTADNDTPDGQQANRRIEFAIVTG